MLEIDGIPPRLENQVCEALLCQQYWYRGQLQSEVDILLLKVNDRWHQLYFENGTIFWRVQNEAPKAAENQPADPLIYPLIDLGEKYSLKDSVISDCLTEPLINGARVSFTFEGRGSLLVTHRESGTSLYFVTHIRQSSISKSEAYEQ